MCVVASKFLVPRRQENERQADWQDESIDGSGPDEQLYGLPQEEKDQRRDEHETDNETVVVLFKLIEECL